MGKGGRKGDGVGALLGCCSLSIALIIAGAVYLTQGNNAGPDREAAIGIYNAAVGAWNTGGSAAFQAQGPFMVSITCSTMPGCGANGNTGIAVNTTIGPAVADPVPIETGSGILPESINNRVAFMTQSNIFASPTVISSDVAKATVTISSQSGTVLSSYQVDLSFFSQTSKGKGACQFGQQVGSNCKGYFVPSLTAGPLCLVVDSNSKIVGGCGINDGMATQALQYFASDPVQSSAFWKINYFSFSYTNQFPSSFVFPATQGTGLPAVVVRSINDPYITFISLTGGYPTFGYRNEATLKKGRILIGVGFGLFSPFLCCLVGVVLVACFDSACKRRPGNYTASASNPAGSTPSAPLSPPNTNTAPLYGLQYSNDTNPNFNGANPGFRRPTFSESVRRRFEQTVDVAGRPFDRAGNGLRSATSRMIGRRPPGINNNNNGLDAQGQPLPDAVVKPASTAPPMLLAVGRDSIVPGGLSPIQEDEARRSSFVASASNPVAASHNAIPQGTTQVRNNNHTDV